MLRLREGRKRLNGLGLAGVEARAIRVSRAGVACYRSVHVVSGVGCAIPAGVSVKIHKFMRVSYLHVI